MLWERLTTQPYVWLPYGNTRQDQPMDRGMHNSVLRRMRRLGHLEWAQSASERTKRTGNLGEAFFYDFLCLELNKPGLSMFKHREYRDINAFRFSRPGLRTREDNEAIDMTFKHEGVWVHVCVKASAVQNLRNTYHSSEEFHSQVDDWFRDVPGPTMVVRVRFNYVNPEDPMGTRCNMYIAVKRNFNQ